MIQKPPSLWELTESKLENFTYAHILSQFTINGLL